MVHRYIDPNQQLIDTKVAAALCVGGAVKYKLVENSNISKQWIYEYVVPSMRAFFGEENRISDVLALPLLWACFEPTMQDRVPAVIRNRIREAYTLCRRLDEDVNPVCKIQLTVYRVADQVCVDELTGIITGTGGDDGAQLEAAQTIGAQQEHIQQLMLQLQETKQQVASLQYSMEASIGGLRTDMGRQFSTVNRNIGRVAIQPPVRRAAVTGNGTVVTTATGLVVELSPHPRTLADLWTEYMHGIGGRKAAKDFTPSERGRVKWKYCRRKVVWDTIGRLCNSGYTVAAACRKIRMTYGIRLSVTQIINAMVKDRRLHRGRGHPNLRVTV